MSYEQYIATEPTSEVGDMEQPMLPINELGRTPHCSCKDAVVYESDRYMEDPSVQDIETDTSNGYSSPGTDRESGLNSSAYDEEWYETNALCISPSISYNRETEVIPEFYEYAEKAHNFSLEKQAARDRGEDVQQWKLPPLPHIQCSAFNTRKFSYSPIHGVVDSPCHTPVFYPLRYESTPIDVDSRFSGNQLISYRPQPRHTVPQNSFCAETRDDGSPVKTTSVVAMQETDRYPPVYCRGVPLPETKTVNAMGNGIKTPMNTFPHLYSIHYAPAYALPPNMHLKSNNYYFENENDFFCKGIQASMPWYIQEGGVSWEGTEYHHPLSHYKMSQMAGSASSSQVPNSVSDFSDFQSAANDAFHPNYWKLNAGGSSTCDSMQRRVFTPGSHHAINTMNKEEEGHETEAAPSGGAPQRNGTIAVYDEKPHAMAIQSKQWKPSGFTKYDEAGSSSKEISNALSGKAGGSDVDTPRNSMYYADSTQALVGCEYSSLSGMNPQAHPPSHTSDLVEITMTGVHRQPNSSSPDRTAGRNEKPELMNVNRVGGTFLPIGGSRSAHYTFESQADCFYKKPMRCNSMTDCPTPQDEGDVHSASPTGTFLHHQAEDGDETNPHAHGMDDVTKRNGTLSSREETFKELEMIGKSSPSDRLTNCGQFVGDSSSETSPVKGMTGDTSSGTSLDYECDIPGDTAPPKKSNRQYPQPNGDVSLNDVLDKKGYAAALSPGEKAVSKSNLFEGSVVHPKGCKPCAFFWSKGCLNGADCKFCHQWHPTKKKKPMKDQKNLMIIARGDQKLEFLRCTFEEALAASNGGRTRNIDTY